MSLHFDCPTVFFPGASGNAKLWLPVVNSLGYNSAPILVEYPGLSGAYANSAVTSVFDFVALSMGCASGMLAAIQRPERFDTISMPTLLISGDSDSISPFGVGQFLAEGILHAKLEIVAGGTHDLVEDYPEAIATLIDKHLS